MRARSSSENPGQAPPWENLRWNPDSLAPELPQLLTSEFWNVVRNTVKFQRSCRSCRICEQGLYPKIRDRHLPGKISAGIPDSLAPELLQLLTSEFWNVVRNTVKLQRTLLLLFCVANPR